MRPAVRDDRQRKAGQGRGFAVAELRLQVSDIRRRLRRQVRSHIHERYVVRGGIYPLAQLSFTDEILSVSKGSS